MKEYRSLSTVVRLILNENFLTENAVDYLKSADYFKWAKPINHEGKLIGYIFTKKRKGTVWYYIGTDDEKEIDRRTKEDKAITALIAHATGGKTSQGDENSQIKTPNIPLAQRIIATDPTDEPTETDSTDEPTETNPTDEPTETDSTDTGLSIGPDDEIRKRFYRNGPINYNSIPNLQHVTGKSVTKNGKDKSLTLPSEDDQKFMFQSTGISDEEFYSKNKSITLPEKSRFKFSEDMLDKLSGKIAASHLNSIERVLNTSFKKNKTETWELFSKITPGDGTVASRCGELITLAMLNLNDDDAKSLLKQLDEHVQNARKDNEKYTSIVDEDWFLSSFNQRKIILKHLQINFIGQDENKTLDIAQTSWDNPEDVKALGFNHSNKGISTDAFIRVHITDENNQTQAYLHEVSLKKDLGTNFFNTTLYGTLEYMAESAMNPSIEPPAKFGEKLFSKPIKGARKLSDDANIGIYAQKQKERLSKFFLSEINHPEFDNFLSMKYGKKQDQINNAKENLLNLITKRFLSKKDAKSKAGIKAGHLSMNKKERRFLYELKDELRKYYEENEKSHNRRYKKKNSNLTTDQIKKLDSEHREMYNDHSDMYGQDEKYGLDFKGHDVYTEHGITMPIKRAAGDKIKITHEKVSKKETHLTPIQRIEMFEEEHSKAYNEFQKNCYREFMSNPGLKEGLNRYVQSVLPLNSVGTGEEQMALDKHSLDTEVMKNVFNTQNVGNINSSMQVREVTGPSGYKVPYIAYVAKNGGETMPISGIQIREDGVGFGGGFKLELQIHKDFGQKIKEESTKIYGE